MFHPELQTGFFKGMADELRAVIGANHRQLLFSKELPLPQRTLQDLRGVFAFAREAHMVVDDGTVIYVNQAE